jgi:hypothetical protein
MSKRLRVFRGGLLSSTGRGGMKLKTGSHEYFDSRCGEGVYVQGEEVEADVRRRRALRLCRSSGCGGNNSGLGDGGRGE